MKTVETKSLNKLRVLLKILIYHVIFLTLVFFLSHCSFSRYAKKSYARAEKEKPYDVIIVPGIPFDKEKTSSMLKMRLYWAKHLYDSGFAKNIIFSGSAVYTPYVESIALKIMGDSLGIPVDVMYAETEAEHSTENVYYSWKLAKRFGFKKIAVATDPFQTAMLRSFIKKHTPDVKTIPIVFGMVDFESKKLPTINYSSAFIKDFVSLKARENLWERFRYTMGKRIKDEKKLATRKPRANDVGSN